MENGKGRYSLFTAIAMIVGICIGAGIFFKADDVLKLTGGSIFLGVVLFVLGALAIVFGGLTIAEMASRTDKPGGVITYAEEFAGPYVGNALGWFHTLIYYPTLVVIVSSVIGIFIDILFDLGLGFLGKLMIGLVFSIICFAYNTLAPKFGGAFQRSSTTIKLIPLVLIAVLGIIFGDPVSGFSSVSVETFKTAGWVSGIGAVAFSYDGWVISTSISHEIKDSKKNLPRALVLGPIIILVIYLSYFVGISSYIGPEKVIEEGDAHVYIAASHMFGEFAAKVVLIVVIISVMGTVNGLIMGYIRLPYSLATRQGAFPFEKVLRRMDRKTDMPVNSAIFAFIICVIWYIAHVFIVTNELLPNSDISEISIAMNYVFYIVLYYRVYKLYKDGQIKSVFRGVICPILATFGSLLVLYGGSQSRMFIYYALICVAVVIVSIVYYKRKNIVRRKF